MIIRNRFSIRYAILCMIFLVSYSCNDQNVSSEDIRLVRRIVEQNPAQALAMLESIESPSTLKEEDRMHYMVTLVQAKNKLDMDVSKDTLIFEAQKFYNDRGDTQLAVLANICAGVVYFQSENLEFSIKSFLKGAEFANNANDELSLGKIYNNIGALYFDQDLMDSAIVYYNKALSSYENINNTQNLKMQTTRFLGRAYDSNNDLDNALKTFYKGLKIANQYYNTKFQFHFNHHIGITLRDMGKYKQSETYLNNALEKATSSSDLLRVYLNFSKLYNLQNQPDKAKNYIDIIKNRLSEIDDNYELNSIYTSLSEYYKQIGDHKESLHYNDLKRITLLKIVDQNEALRVVKANHEYLIADKEAGIRSLNYQVILFSTLILLVLYLFIRIIWSMFRYQKERKMQEDLDLRMFKIHAKNMCSLSRTYDESLAGIMILNKESTILRDRGERQDYVLKVEKTLSGMVKSNFTENLIEWAKGYILELPFGNKIMENFSNKEILLLVLYSYKYSEAEISQIIYLPEEDIKSHLPQIIKKLKDIDLTESQIELMLSVGNM